MLGRLSEVAPEVVGIGLVNIVRDYVVGAVVLGVAEDLDVFRVGHHDSFPIELKILSEAFHASLAKAYVFVAQLCLRLEKRSYRATKDHLDVDWLVLFVLANGACRSQTFRIVFVVIASVERSSIFYLMRGRTPLL